MRLQPLEELEEDEKVVDVVDVEQEDDVVQEGVDDVVWVEEV